MTEAVDLGFNLTTRDYARLKGVHTDLARVVHQASQFANDRFMVVEGLREEKRQRMLVDTGASRTMDSRHLTGHAVDLAPVLSDGTIPWNQWHRFDALAETMKRAAAYLKVPIEWGGDWPKFRDGPHFQLPRDKYPA